MSAEIIVTGRLHWKRGRDNQRKIVAEPVELPPAPLGRTHRITRLMALAIRFDKLIREGQISDQAELARLGHITRARVTQIMNLLLLAPDIQEDILHLPLVKRGRDPLRERHLRPITAVLDWRKQRRLWRECVTQKN